jgi:mannitol/fructose-specific phosphotransferase system IIA component (Ntr-type)
MTTARNVIQHCRVEHCVAALAGDERELVIRELVARFVASGALPEHAVAEVISRVLAREGEGTTGIGGGVAMPHARTCEHVDETLIGVGLHADGVDWEATDGEPVHVVFLIVSNAPEEYLSVASRIARVARDGVEIKALRRQASAELIHAFLEETWSA